MRGDTYASSRLVARVADINNYIYIPSLAGAVVSCVVFGIIAIVLSVQIRRNRVRYPIILAVGAGCESLGYFFRALSASGRRLTSFPLFLLMDMFVILSPLAFMAGLYIVYGRLVRRFAVVTGPGPHHGADDDNDVEKLTTGTTTAAAAAARPVKFSFIPPQWYARIFVTCDVTSFLIQAAGAGLIVSKTVETARLGKDILMAGLAFGLATFGIFVSLILYTNVVVNRHARRGTFLARGLATDRWRVGVLVPMLTSAACILARTVYRLVEFAEGYSGHIYTTEWYLYVFDTTLMVICIGIWIPFFPAKYGLDQSLTGVVVDPVVPVSVANSSREEQDREGESRTDVDLNHEKHDALGHSSP